MLFLTIINYFIISYLRLLQIIFGYSMLFHFMLLLAILLYITIGYLWLLYWW